MELNDSDLFLRFIALRNPYVWEVVGGGPLGRLGQVALNPQPLPPHEIGAALVAVLAERAAVHGSFSRFAEDIEDWCGTGWPHHIPKPKGEGPDPLPWRVFLGAAVAAVELAHGLDGTDAEQVAAGAQRLFEQAGRFGG
ncbi:hypothetical protein [Phycicoccus sp.]|uniref:hypothetical protein n=1 Tax=Phycicoccus sp. TaxID=1902410 RepID=UPI002B66827D|nr:hypothetical protein [Phycicoccus sp.]HMM96305.1 hypothetical protein [Phycicoccus sp.]